jgi:hypothetical protein
MRLSTFRASVAVVCEAIIVMSAALLAQRGGGRGGVDVNGVPLATNAILTNPDAYYGKQVTVSAGVEEMLSKTAFVLDQWKATGPKEVGAIGKPILVIAPYLTASFDTRSYVLVRGELVKFDQAALARVKSDYQLDVTPAIWARYQGQPILLASSVLTSTYKEVGRKPIPPPSPVEVALGTVMKSIGPLFAGLMAAAQDSKTDVVAKNAAALEPEFTEAETIWDGLGQSPAAQWAREARERAAAIGSAVSANDWGAVKASAGSLNQICQSCHAAYRERQDDATFRIKPGSF